MRFFKSKVLGVILLILAFAGLITLVAMDILKSRDSVTTIASSSSSRDDKPLGKTESTPINPGSSRPSLGDLELDEYAKPIPEVSDLPKENVSTQIWEVVDGEKVPTYTPWIDWSSKELITEDVIHLQKIIERYLNEQEKNEDISIAVNLPSTDEELAMFKDGIVYTVHDDGSLTIACKITVINYGTEKEHSIFQPVTIKYDMATIKVLTKVEY